MQARKKAGAAKAATKKANVRKSNGTRASTAKVRTKAATAKATTGSSRAKKVRTTKPAKARTTKASAKAATAKLAKGKKPSVRAKSAAKTGVGRVSRTARKPPIVRKNAPKTQNRATKAAVSTTSKAGQANGKPSGPSEVIAMREDHVANATTQTPAHFEISREPVRGGLHDGANHSKPEVQLQRQHIQTTRSPERRHTMRGH